MPRIDSEKLDALRLKAEKAVDEYGEARRKYEEADQYARAKLDDANKAIKEMRDYALTFTEIPDLYARMHRGTWGV